MSSTSSSTISDANAAIEKLAGRPATAAQQYEQLKQDCEAKVNETRWATAEMNHLRLLHTERGRGPRGRWLKNTPKNKENYFDYGLDSENRPVVIWRGIVEQIYIVYKEDYAEAVKYTSLFLSTGDVEGVSVLRQLRLKGRPVDCTWFAAHQRGYEKYKYTSGLLTGIDATWTNQPHRPKDVLSAEYEAKYDDAGSLVLLTGNYRAVGRHSGGSVTCYKKRVRK